MFLEISQNSYENSCARVSFLIKLQAQTCNFIKKGRLTQVFSCEFCKISINTFFTEHFWTTASQKCVYFDIFYGSSRLDVISSLGFAHQKMHYLFFMFFKFCFVFAYFVDIDQHAHCTFTGKLDYCQVTQVNVKFYATFNF